MVIHDKGEQTHLLDRANLQTVLPTGARCFSVEGPSISNICQGRHGLQLQSGLREFVAHLFG